MISKFRASIYVSIVSVGALIAKLVAPPGHIHPRRRWCVYHLREDEPTDFTLRQFKSVVAPDCYSLIDESAALQSLPPGNPLFYIGHGDPGGVYSSGAFRVGIKHYLCSARNISSGDWVSTPSVWWACHSATWLAESRSTDWLGFRDLIGYDLSTAVEKQWWEATLQKVIRAVVLVADGAESVERLKSLLTGLVAEAALSQHTGQRRTHMSQLLVIALEESINHGQRFGENNE